MIGLQERLLQIKPELGIKTIERVIKEIDNLKYIGSGNNGYWELNE